MAGVANREGSSSSTVSDQTQRDRRNRVVLGNLPDDFLRPDATTLEGYNPSHQELVDRQLAMQLQQQQQLAAINRHQFGQNYAGQLIITVVEATFVKNYGMTRMDPYARLRIGSTIYETHACASGGKTPRWNKRISCYLPIGVKAISVEVYDECALTMDELIGYGQIPIPDQVFSGEAVDEWYQLSGKQGENKEGSIHLIFTLLPIPSMVVSQGNTGVAMAPTYGGYLGGGSVTPVSQVPVAVPQMVMVPAGYGVPTYAAMPVYNLAGNNSATLQSAPFTSGSSQAATPLNPPPLTEEEIQEICSMFPSMDRQVIQSIIDACGGRREAIIDSLLQVSEQ